jgi:hypothetical protein
MTFGGEFTLLDEATEYVDIVVGAKLAADEPEWIGSAPRPGAEIEASVIFRSIPWSRLSETRRRAGGHGRKSMDLKQIWPPMIVELLLGEDKKAAESMTHAPRFPTDGANRRRLTSTMSMDMDLGFLGKRCAGGFVS